MYSCVVLLKIELRFKSILEDSFFHRNELVSGAVLSAVEHSCYKVRDVIIALVFLFGVVEGGFVEDVIEPLLVF